MSRAIASLALVKVAWDTYHKDYIENFLPFIATLIKRYTYKEIDSNKLAPFIDNFKEEFGLYIPHHPMIAILNRATKRGLFYKNTSKFYPNEDKILGYDFSDKVIKKNADLNQLINEFIKYSKEKYSKDISNEEAEEGFNSFLKSHDLDLLFASQQRTLLPDSKTSKNIKYLLNSFFCHIQGNDSTLFSSLIDICIGHVLACTILYDNDFNKFCGRLKKTEIYLDSGIIFRLLGMEGVEYQRVYRDLINSLLAQKAILCLFEHTKDEVLKILHSSLKWINSPSYNPSKASIVLKYFKQNNKTESDIRQYLSTFDRELDGYKIEIKNSPEFNISPKYQIDEKKLEEKIIERYKANLSFNEFDKKETIQKDIKSISSINHLRKGVLPQSITNSGYIFITSNGSLAYANQKFEDDEYKGKFHIPACLTDVFIGTVIWIQSPAKLIEIKRKEFIANCVAALKPDELFIKKVLEKAKQLKDANKISDDEFILFNQYNYTYEILMEETLGDCEAINTHSIEEIIKEMKRADTHIVEEKYLEEKKKTEALEEKINNHELEKQNRKKDISVKVRYVGNIVFGIVIILLIISCFCDSIIFRVISAISIVAGAVCKLNLKGIKDKLIKRITEYIFSRLYKGL